MEEIAIKQADLFKKMTKSEKLIKLSNSIDVNNVNLAFSILTLIRVNFVKLSTIKTLLIWSSYKMDEEAFLVVTSYKNINYLLERVSKIENELISVFSCLTNLNFDNVRNIMNINEAYDKFAVEHDDEIQKIVSSLFTFIESYISE